MQKMIADEIAPCGMNCRLCYGFIRSNHPCKGCNAIDTNKSASCIDCDIISCEKRRQNGWQTCAFCEEPCRRLKYLDKHYRAKYHMSMLENLAIIREQGMNFFLQQQEDKFQCPNCGGTVCVHQNTCPNCNQKIW